MRAHGPRQSNREAHRLWTMDEQARAAQEARKGGGGIPGVSAGHIASAWGTVRPSITPINYGLIGICARFLTTRSCV
jgi:hypothetical protein